mmetsp:Transcript_34892/g.56162  ORF Transcript_34892/g.56162 Transcript_34892/m.56162 type:complete len:135 (-) Transcript_34892:26-430(-)
MVKELNTVRRQRIINMASQINNYSCRFSIFIVVSITYLIIYHVYSNISLSQRFVSKVKPYLTKSLTVFDYAPSTFTTDIPTKECKSKNNNKINNGNNVTSSITGGSLSVLIVCLPDKVNLASFLKSCKDAAHKV